MTSVRYTSINGVEMENVDGVTRQVSIEILASLMCPITNEILQDPMVFDGDVFEHEAILKWYRSNGRSPLTGRDIAFGSIELIPAMNVYVLLLCLELRDEILYLHEYRTTDFIMKKVAHGIYNKSHFESCQKYMYCEEGRCVLHCRKRGCDGIPHTFSLSELLPVRELIDEPDGSDGPFPKCKYHADAGISVPIYPMSNFLFCAAVGSRGTNPRPLETYRIQTSKYAGFFRGFFDADPKFPALSSRMFTDLKQHLFTEYVPLPDAVSNIHRETESVVLEEKFPSLPMLDFYHDYITETTLEAVMKRYEDFLNQADKSISNLCRILSCYIHRKKVIDSNFTSVIHSIKHCYEMPMFGYGGGYSGDISYLMFKRVRIVGCHKGTCAVGTIFEQCTFDAEFVTAKFINCAFIDCNLDGLSIKKSLERTNLYIRCTRGGRPACPVDYSGSDEFEFLDESEEDKGEQCEQCEQHENEDERSEQGEGEQHENEDERSEQGEGEQEENE